MQSVYPIRWAGADVLHFLCWLTTQSNYDKRRGTWRTWQIYVGLLITIVRIKNLSSCHTKFAKEYCVGYFVNDSQLWSSNKRWDPSFPFWRIFKCDVFVSMTGYQCPYLHIPYRSHLSWIGSPILSCTFTFVLLADLQILILLHRNQITLLSRKSKDWKL